MTEPTRAERDPIEQMDMKADLEKLRELFEDRGYTRVQSSNLGEVWTRNMGGNPGYKLTLFMDEGGRIRCEIRNPVGKIVNEISPAYPIDVEPAIPR